MLFYHCQVWTDYIIWYQLFNVGKLDKILTEYEYQWKLKQAGHTNYALIILKFNSLRLTLLIILERKNNPHSFVNNKKKRNRFSKWQLYSLGATHQKWLELYKTQTWPVFFIEILVHAFLTLYIHPFKS